MPRDVAEQLKTKMMGLNDLHALYVEHGLHDLRLFDVLKTNQQIEDFDHCCQTMIDKYLKRIKADSF